MVKTNDLENLMAKNLWRLRRKQRDVYRRIHLIEAVIDVIFASPVIAGTIILMAIQRAEQESEIDATILFTIIGAMSSLRGVLNSLADALNAYRSFLPAMQMFEDLFNKVNRSPRVAVFTIKDKEAKTDSSSNQQTKYT